MIFNKVFGTIKRNMRQRGTPVRRTEEHMNFFSPKNQRRMVRILAILLVAAMVVGLLAAIFYG